MAKLLQMGCLRLYNHVRAARGIRLLAPLALSSLLVGCGALNTPPQAPAGAPLDKMDVTIGTYGLGREERLILVTIESAAHKRMVHNLPINSKVNAPSALPIRYAKFLQDLRERYGITRVADWPLPVLGIHCLVFESDGRISRDDIVAQLNTEEQVETAQPMQMFEVQQQKKQSEQFYNDPFLPLQHGFQTMQAEQSHQWARGDGITVAVIDTGMDLTHPDLVDSVGGQRNFVDKNELQFQSDIHGTAVAGVIAAAADNNTGMVGVAPDSKLLALKACWQKDATSEAASCNSFTLAKALNFAINNDVEIINLSLSGPRDPLLERLVKLALEENIIVVGAIGPAGHQMFPVVVPGTIAVASEDTGATKSVLAPGRKVLSTRPQSNYEFYDGNSFSAAHIAGLAALIREMNKSWTPVDVLELLDQTAHPESGAVNACRALASLAGSDSQACPLPST